MIDIRFENQEGVCEKLLIGIEASFQEIKAKCEEVFFQSKYGFLFVCNNGFCEKVAVMVDGEIVFVDYEPKC